MERIEEVQRRSDTEQTRLANAKQNSQLPFSGLVINNRRNIKN
jgi:hypothetical protein